MHFAIGGINAIVGPSGAGKTTLLEILCSMLKPDAGQVSINQEKADNFGAIGKGVITIVPQDFQLLNDTIRRNVSFSIEDKDIDDARVWEALESASLAARIRALPQQLYTVVGEEVALSGGERQRMAIARALYQAPNLLILDEATSVLDVATERNIMQTLSVIAQGTLVLFVTHRLGTLADCANVAFLKEGKLVAQGSCAQLTTACESFQTFIASEPAQHFA
jgi:ABC-type multidrug transport system fused ATPase/permease subunit